MNYTLQNNGVRYWTGVTKDGRQVIIGPSIPNILIYLFTPEGVLLEKIVVKLAIPPVWDEQQRVYRTDAAFLDAMEQQIAAVQRKLGVIPQSIQIHEFYDDEEDVGIRELPSEFEEYLDNPDRYSDEDRESINTSIKEWNDKQRFIFVWGDELWMARDGEVLSS